MTEATPADAAEHEHDWIDAGRRVRKGFVVYCGWCHDRRYLPYGLAGWILFKLGAFA